MYHFEDCVAKFKQNIINEKFWNTVTQRAVLYDTFVNYRKIHNNKFPPLSIFKRFLIFLRIIPNPYDFEYMPQPDDFESMLEFFPPLTIYFHCKTNSGSAISLSSIPEDPQESAEGEEKLPDFLNRKRAKSRHTSSNYVYTTPVRSPTKPSLRFMAPITLNSDQKLNF